MGSMLSVFIVHSGCVRLVCVCFTNCFRISSSGSVTMYLSQLILEILFGCYLYWLYMLAVPGDQSSCLCYSYMVHDLLLWLWLLFLLLSHGSTVPHLHSEPLQ